MKEPEQQSEAAEEMPANTAEDPGTDNVEPVWTVRINLQIVREKQSSAPWEEQQAYQESVKVQLVLVDSRPKRRRILYTLEQKALAPRILEKAGNSPALVVRRLLLNCGELFLGMNEITCEKNLRMWQRKQKREMFATNQDSQQKNLHGRKPMLSPSCEQAIHRVILGQVTICACFS